MSPGCCCYPQCHWDRDWRAGGFWLWGDSGMWRLVASSCPFGWL